MVRIDGRKRFPHKIRTVVNSVLGVKRACSMTFIDAPVQSDAKLPFMRVIAGEFRGRKLLPPEGEVTRPITDRVKQSLFDILAPRLEGAIVWDLFAGTGSLGLESLSRGSEQAVFFETDRSAVARLRRNIVALGLRHNRAVVQPIDVFKWFRGWDCTPKRHADQEGLPRLPSPGTPEEGQGERLPLPGEKGRTVQNGPHPNPLPEYREREKNTDTNDDQSFAIDRESRPTLTPPASGAPSPRADIIFLDPPYRYLTDQPQDLRRLGRLFARQHLRPQGIVVFRHDARDTLELPDLTRYDERTYGGMMLEFLAVPITD